MNASFDHQPLLQVQDFGVVRDAPGGESAILKHVSFELHPGEILGVIGESGAGKSTLGNAVLGLLSPQLKTSSGRISFAGQPINPSCLSNALRGRRIAAIFQDHAASLDPLMSVGGQVEETVRALNGALQKGEARQRATELMRRVGIPDPERRYHHYPHQFSGGQRQRLVIAMALAGAPDIIVADEPTSALDATVQRQVLELLRSLVDETGVSIILVTHDMGVIADITDRILVMRQGEIVEQGQTDRLLDQPQQAYTRQLLSAVPRLRVSSPKAQAVTPQIRLVPKDEDPAPLLVADKLTKSFRTTGFYWSDKASHTRFALQSVTIALARGAITGVVGESGSGKSTLGRILAGLQLADSGTVSIDGQSFDVSRPGHRSGLLGRVQMIFQDPALSLNPRMTVAETLSESLRYKGGRGGASASGDLNEILDRLELARDLLSRHPHQLSGGQKQRVCIARALLADPRIIIADEPTSALDVSVQAEIVRLLKQVVSDSGMTMMFISHDLALVQDLCEQVTILKDGQIEDSGPCGEVFAQSTKPYTRALLAARSQRFIC